MLHPACASAASRCCPGCGVSVAGAAGSEIRARNQNFSAFVFGTIEDELGIVFAIGQKSPIEKQSATQSATHHRLEKLLGNDLIGIDVGSIEWRHQSGKIFERFHLTLFFLKVGTGFGF